MTAQCSCMSRSVLLALGLLLIPLPAPFNHTPVGAALAFADCEDPDADPDLDSDGDDVPDCEDECPNDRLKFYPGTCGCGIPDADSDHDGWVDQGPSCQEGPDLCPTDTDKVEPLSCGCGYFEPDAFEDGTVECDNPEDQDISMSLNGRGGRIRVRLSRFQGAVSYVVTVRSQRPGSRRWRNISGFPRTSASNEIQLNLARGTYKIIGQVRNGDSRSIAVTRTYVVRRR